ncbi:MAG: hypothetical protein HYX68_26545 [Planctomycetes bacterium]|nr:hypothetical protein [Planctomycetota bacterium]
MNFEAPQMVTDLLPEGLRAYALYILGGALCLVGLVGLLLLIVVFRLLFGGRAKKSPYEKNLIEQLSEYPDLKTSSGDKQLRIEGVPVRVRLVVIAPAGTASDLDEDELGKILEQLLPGLGDVLKHDKPRVRVWPTQVSYQGFATHFHRNTVTGAAEGEQTRWAMIAGRIKVGKKQYMLGLALQSIKPNTVGRRTVDSHEWASVLRVRVRD